MCKAFSRVVLVLTVLCGIVRAADFRTSAEEWQAQHQRSLDEAGKLSAEGDTMRGNQLLIELAQNDRSGIGAFIVANMLYRVDPATSYRLHARALEAFPAEPAVRLEVAMEQHRKGEYQAAIANYEKVLSGFDRHFFCLLADCYIRTGQLKEAVRAWERAGHGNAHTSIDFDIYEIYGDLMPQQRRSTLIASIKPATTDKLAELIGLDLNFEQDWWNTSVNDKALDQDLKLAERLLGENNPFYRQLAIHARLARNTEKKPAEIRNTLISAGLVLGDHAALPENSYLARLICDLVIRSEAATRVDLWRIHEAALKQRVTKKDRDALHLLCLLAVDADKSQLSELERIGWKEWGDPEFAVSYLVGLVQQKKITDPNDGEILAAEKALPDDNTLVGLRLMLTGENRIGTELVVAAIKAEYHKLSFGLIIPDSYKLKGLFSLLGKLVEVTDEKTSSPAPAKSASQATPPPKEADLLRLSATDALAVSIPKSWHVEATKPPQSGFPFSTFVLRPNGDRNAECLITVYAKNDPRAADMNFLRQLLTDDSAPWIATTADHKMTPVNSLLFTHGKGSYASFVDAKSVGMPIKRRDYKIVTGFMLCIDKLYLTKVTVLCDDLSSPDYREALAIVKSLAAAK